MYEDIKPENVTYLDIETQHLITEFEGGWKNPKNYAKLKIAELGILQNDIYKTFNESNIDTLTNELDYEQLIVGHNIIGFDYKVLEHYIPKDIMFRIILKSFDTMLEFDKFTGEAGWVSLDDIAQRNFGMKKTEDSIKIPEMWREGRIDEVKHYLLNDLKMTEQFYLLGKKGHTFKYDHKVYGKSHGEKEVYVKW